MKKLIIFLFISLLSLNIFAKRNFACDVIMSLQDKNMDWWYCVPENSSPYVQNLKDCYREEKLNFFLFFKFVEDMQEMDFEYEVFLIDQEGMEEIILPKTEFKYKNSQKGSILALPKHPSYKFPNDAKLGEYKVLLRLVFEGEIFDFVKTINLTTEAFPKAMQSSKEATNFMFNYLKVANPSKLLAMFISDKVPVLKKGAPNGLDFLFLSFFKHAFDAQPFLYNKLLHIYLSADENLKKKIVVFFAYANKPFEDIFYDIKENKEVHTHLVFQNSFNAHRNAYAQLKDEYAPAQLDMLWGEFYATGRYKTFLKIISTLDHTEEGAYAENLVRSNKKALSKADKEKFAVGMTYLNTLKRISLNFDNDLFLKYLYYSMDSKKLPSSVSIQLAILIKTANENSKPQKEPEIINIGNLKNIKGASKN